MIIDIQQNTSEWLELRRVKIGASDLPIIMGDSPWTTPYQLWQEKVGIKPPKEETFAMSEGKRKEPIALVELNRLLNMNMKPAVLLRHESSFAMASLDALQLHENGRILCAAEIKCSGTEDHATAVSGKVPKKYKAQLQWQLYVTNLEMMYYFSFDGEKGVVVEVRRDQTYIDQLFEAAEEFKRCVDQFIPPPMTEKEQRQSQLVQIEDSENLAGRYFELGRIIEDLTEQREDYKQRLIELSGGSDASGMGFKLSKVVTKGRLDYDAILSHYKVDVDLCQEFRKPSTESWRISSEL